MVHILYILCYISSVQKNVGDGPRAGRSGRRGERIMHLDALVTWLLVGLVAGGLAGFLIRPGGYGWRADLLPEPPSRASERLQDRARGGVRPSPVFTGPAAARLICPSLFAPRATASPIVGKRSRDSSTSSPE